MTLPSALRRANDPTQRSTGGDRDPQIVKRYELLAENMPSVLAQLRPIDPTSDGIRRYFITRDSQLRRSEPTRGAPLVTRTVEFCGDVAGVLALGLLLPIAILVVGTPLVLGVRVLLAILG